MGCAVACAASHRRLYLAAAAGTDSRHLGKGVGVGGWMEVQGVHMERAVSSHQANAEEPQFPREKILLQWPLPATTVCDSPGRTCKFGLDHSIVFAPIRKSPV